MGSHEEDGVRRFAAKGAPDDDDDDKPGDTDKSDGKPVAETDDDAPETPESRFEDRYPQDVRVSDLVGKPLLEVDNTPIGRIRAVVRSPDGKLKLIVPLGGFLGFGGRLVAVPNESVASTGTAIISLDMDHAAYAQAATWTRGPDTILPSDTPMRVAIIRH